MHPLAHLFLNMVVLGVLSALHPTPPLAAVLVLGTDRPVRNIGGFGGGWAGSLVVVFGIGALAGATAGDAAELVADLLEISLGVALLAAALVAARRGGSGLEAAGIPPWVEQRMTRLHPAAAAAIGVAVQPWAFTLAAALSVARDGTGPASTVAALGVFGILSSSLVLAVVADFVRHPARARTRLQDLEGRMVGSGRRTLILVSAAAALYLVIDGVWGLLRR